MRNFKRGVFFCALANLVLMAPLCVLFLLVAAFFEHLVAGAPLPDLAPYAVGCVAVVAAVAATQALEYRFTYGPVYQESTRKREAIAEHLRRLPLSFFGKRDLSDLTSAIMKDCADQERMFMHVMPQLFGTGISTLVMAVGIVAFDWRLGIAAFWPVPVAFAIFAATSRAARRKVAAKEERRLALADGVQEYLDCAQEIRATNQARAFLRDLGGKLDDFERSEVASELLTGVSISSSQAVLKLGIASVVLVGAGLMVSGQVGFLTYFGFLLVVTRVYDPVNVVLQSSSELLEMRHAIRRTNGLMRTPAMGGSPEFRPRGFDLSFEDVSFSYGEGARVLDRVSFTAREGQVTALVGPSGSGKSTCAKLAARFWDPDAGTVRLGGVDVSGIDPEALLSAYAEVFQDVVLFDETVMENIRLGRADATDGEVLAAARAANCDEFVHALPEGYQTRIGGERRAPFRWRAAAHLHCTRPSERRARGASGRGHGQPGRGERKPGAARAFPVTCGKDGAGDCPQDAHRDGRGQGGGAGGRHGGGAGRAGRPPAARRRPVPPHGGAAGSRRGLARVRLARAAPVGRGALRRMRVRGVVACGCRGGNVVHFACPYAVAVA